MYVTALLYLLGAFFMGMCFTAPTPTENYIHSAKLRTGKMNLYWKIEEEFILFEVHGQTLGWVGIGFSPNGGMRGADIVVGWVKDGIVQITDRHGVGNEYPPTDKEQNLDKISGYEDNGWTVLKFRRQIAACEKDYDREITSDTHKLIWAIGDKDPSGDDLDPMDYHQPDARGTQSIILLHSLDSHREEYSRVLAKTAPIESQLTMTNVTIPPIQTYYHCKIIKLPNLSSKEHVIKIRPVISEGNDNVVHHMILYQCDKTMQENENVESHCFSPDMPKYYKHCETMIAGYAIGGGDFYFPPNVGYPIGGEENSLYFQLEIHYDNAMNLTDLIDSSGFELVHTKKLREFDAGMALFGNSVDGFQHFIPPGTSSFSTTGHCMPECLSKVMEDSKTSQISVFATLLHTHATGRALRVRHIRNGTELPYIAHDNSYDFNYQEIRFLREERIIYPEDALQVHCSYDTTNVKDVLVGGLGTADEMCVAFLFYYPRVDLGQCSSVPLAEESYQLLNISSYNVTGIGGLKDVYVTAPEEFVGKTAAEVINEMSWDEETSIGFSAALTKTVQVQKCEGNKFVSENKQFYAPMIKEPYQEPHLECKEVPKEKKCPDAATCKSAPLHYQLALLVGLLHFSRFIFSSM